MSKFKDLVENSVNPPSLERLVQEAGGWDKITEEEWKRFNYDRRVWVDRMLLGLIRKKPTDKIYERYFGR
jgi:hypothetical protein